MDIHKSYAEYIYVIPNGDDKSQCGPEYLEYSAFRKIMSSSITEFKKARALSAKTKVEPEPTTNVMNINTPVSNVAVIKTTTASPDTPVTPRRHLRVGNPKSTPLY